ncbi:hypothetical protein Q4543_16905 [Salipiger sp. 1_MG-2023]|uniref:hypothetical protein n=1 Tax=Salipiger sp. 1_MG-2023 TaxID=3062665 RepID=UPI0026E26667|nr:hypothetical protein [Salipiger sp. 1_MG-2023]MDO6587195.1 hypothetical protein [Salipiger sp. 1_MG-2023]
MKHILSAIIAFALGLATVLTLANEQTPSAVYGQACSAAIGPIPSFDCAEGVAVPITVNGVEITDHVPQSCDRPALLDNGHGPDGQCVPFSRILNLSTKTAQVSVMCRQKVFRGATSTDYDEIDVIAHNPATGETCWFQAKGESAPVSGTAVPSPTEASSAAFWAAPETVLADGCGTCHDNDPFMYSPFVGQVWDHVPTNPLGPYAHVDAGLGFARWPTHQMSPRDNTCLGCHRIGTGALTAMDGAAPMDDFGGKPGSCGQLAAWMTGAPFPGANAAARSWPLSHAMPPDIGLSEAAWREIYGEAIAQVQTCCAEPSQAQCVVSKILSYQKVPASP